MEIEAWEWFSGLGKIGGVEKFGLLACLLIASKLLAGLSMLNNRLIFYYWAAVVFPYCLFFLNGEHFAVDERAWWVAAWHGAVGFWMAWQALPGKWEREAALGWVICPPALTALLAFALTPTGVYQRYSTEYLLLIGSCLLSALWCFGACLYVIRDEWKAAQWACLIAAIWFGVSAGLGGVSRYWPEGWLWLNGMESAVHIGCLLAWGRLAHHVDPEVTAQLHQHGGDVL